MKMYQAIAENYDFIFPYNPLQKKFILSTETKRNRFCDLGCGTGALAANLTQQFSEIVAIDNSPDMIHFAKKRNAPGVDYFVGSMLKIKDYFWKEHFDVVTCFGNTIVHLSSEEEILNLFKQVKSITKKNGVFLGQIINYNHILDNNITELPTIENNNILFKRYYNLSGEGDQFDFVSDLTVKNRGKTVHNSVRLLAIRKEKIDSLLQEAGFDSIKFSSDFEGADYDSKKLPLIFEAR